MDKEARLRELRELGDVHTVKENVHGVNNVKTDVDVVKYLDALRRKATTIDEVDVIDLIMRCLFHEGKNKVTGRVHGDQVEERLGEKAEQHAAKSDRKAYHRDYMRARRQKDKA